MLDEVMNKEEKEQVDSGSLRLTDHKRNMEEKHDHYSKTVSNKALNITNSLSGNMRPCKDSFLECTKVKYKHLLRLAGSEPCASNFRAGSSYSMGCRVVTLITEPVLVTLHETKSIIFRHEPSGDLIVAFCETATNKQVKTDLMTFRIGVDLDTFLPTTSKRHHV